MKLDIYKRAETGGHFSYLAVPEGKVIPNEVTNIDWEDAERGLDFDEREDALPAYSIDQPAKQISAKGYAITSVRNIGHEE
ncbi:MAG: hypothetical protein H7327_12855 [Herminiimonas sp.]|nr:hypothetical protein [Herminiimonas sp.]